ncbi:MAG: hypothetical protein WCG27_01185 [Pseudomonadota bacterium]
MNRRRELFLPFLLSFLLHIVLGGALLIIYPYLSPSNNYSPPPDKVIALEKISPQELQRLKTVGVTNGAKDFSIPMPTPNASAPDKIDLTKKENNVTLAELRPRSQKTLEKMAEEKDKKDKMKNEAKEPQADYGFQRAMQQDVLKEMAVNSDNAPALRSTGFNIQFTPPDGVKEDELNGQDKIFYSFQKRTYMSYLNSFIKTYNKKVLERPIVKLAFSNENHNLTGRVVFDKMGNIVSIKIIQWSDNDEIEKLFEETLESIGALPNPPKALLEEKEQFTVYYSLKING